MDKFESMGLRAATIETLGRMRLVTPTEVQARALPELLRGRDCVIQSPTGSGKTIAFLLPMVERLRGPLSGGPRALVVAPSRELAGQILSVLGQLDRGLHRALVVGGVAYGPQIQAVRRADVVVGCPGRLLDLARRGDLRLGAVEYLVLDEVDVMLDAGFARDVEALIRLTRQDPGSRQTVVASATVPNWVSAMIDRHLTEPAQVRVAPAAAADLVHGLLAVGRAEKVDVLHRLLRHSTSTIVFHRTKHGAKKLARQLSALGHATAELQGNLSQPARQRALEAFRNRQADVLVATNVAARGIDVSHVSLVVNFELPETAEWLTHRVGRTARNGSTGRALTFLSEDDGPKWKKLSRQGAPALPFVDGERLLASGDMRFLAARPPQSDAGSARRRDAAVPKSDQRQPTRPGVRGMARPAVASRPAGPTGPGRRRPSRPSARARDGEFRKSA